MEIAEELKILDDEIVNQFIRNSNNKIEYWDIRAGLNIGTLIDFTNQKSKEINSYENIECSIRTFVNGGWGFYVLKDLNSKSLLNGFLKAIKLAKMSESLTNNKFKITQRDPLIKNFRAKVNKKVENIDIEEKINLVKNHEKIASNYSNKVKNTRTVYIDGYSSSIFINSSGSYITQNLDLLRLYSVVYAQEAGIIQKGSNSVGGIGGFEIVETEKATNLSKKSANEAVDLLKAKSPVGGKFDVIMDPKLTGTFVHEAFGHACEADLVLSKESILEGKIGEKVANDQITIIDNPSFGQGRKYNLPYELYGSYFIDDEGIPAQKTVIIENGEFKNYLHNLETASRMNVNPNGHGRAQSSNSKPQVRMGFTYLEPRDWELNEIINDTNKGILCEDFQYGYTDPTTGNFQFKCKISYKIENGEKTQMMRDVSLSGLTLEVLNKVTAIGNQNSFDYSDGLCGKGGQSLRVCDGGPYIRIADINVGGLN
ncbi:MAG: TldD/PmbA family protein [Candidatus Heimdallarchaeota archaeon]